MKHPVYFFHDGDIVIKVGDTMHRIHKYFLIRESKHFRTIFVNSVPCRDPPGLSETNPVVLDDATSEGFADLLWVFYNHEYSIYNAPLDKWKRILTLAQRWGFIQVEKLCVRELEKLSIPPVEKIQLYQDFKIDPNLLHASYAALTIRPEPLDIEEGKKLELSTSLKIAQARELARAPGGTTDLLGSVTPQLEESDVLSVIRNVFELQEPASDSSTPPLRPEPTPTGKQNPTNDDPVDKASGKNKKNNRDKTW